jgi:hypothetical protein
MWVPGSQGVSFLANGPQIEEVKGVNQVLDQEEEIAMKEFARFEEKLRQQKGQDAVASTVGKGSLDYAEGWTGRLAGAVTQLESSKSMAAIETAHLTIRFVAPQMFSQPLTYKAINWQHPWASQLYERSPAELRIVDGKVKFSTSFLAIPSLPPPLRLLQ